MGLILPIEASCLRGKGGLLVEFRGGKMAAAPPEPPLRRFLRFGPRLVWRSHGVFDQPPRVPLSRGATRSEGDEPVETVAESRRVV
jgi:hypothetical protein